MPVPPQDSADFVGPPGPRSTPRRKKKKKKSARSRSERGIDLEGGKGTTKAQEKKSGGTNKLSSAAIREPRKRPLSETLTSVAASVGPGRTSIGRIVQGGLAGAAVGAAISESRAESKGKRKKKKDKGDGESTS